MNKHVKFLLIMMTAAAVISDAVLLPFYPQFFAERFAITDTRYVGIYISCVCLMVMIAFPIWAKIARRVSEIPLLLLAQLGATLLAIACFYVQSLLVFWVVSLAMFACKASYLLIYPLTMRLDAIESHEKTIGILSVIVHLGFIFGALIGGYVLEFQQAEVIYWYIAAGDFMQFLLCAYLYLSFYPLVPANNPLPTHNQNLPDNFMLRLGLVMLVFYFGANLVSPFFVSYWQSFAQIKTTWVAGLVYAIPGSIALIILLWFKPLQASLVKTLQKLPLVLGVGVMGYGLQTVAHEVTVLLGRVLLGISLFYAVVRLDLLMFKVSKPDDYGSAFGLMYFFQNSGVILAFYSAGVLVQHQQWHLPFYGAAVAFVIAILLVLQLSRLVAPPAHTAKSGLDKPATEAEML